jgi:hypothetical protein
MQHNLQQTPYIFGLILATMDRKINEISLSDLMVCGLYGNKETDRVIDFYLAVNMYGAEWVEKKAFEIYNQLLYKKPEQLCDIFSHIFDVEMMKNAKNK